MGMLPLAILAGGSGTRLGDRTRHLAKALVPVAGKPFIAHQLTLARREGVQHVVVTHAMQAPVEMTIPQMQEAARAGAYIEFVYGGLVGQKPAFQIGDYAKAIRAVGPASCILSSDLGQPANPLHPDGLAAFFQALRNEGFSQSEIDLMSKTNPARALGL